MREECKKTFSALRTKLRPRRCFNGNERHLRPVRIRFSRQNPQMENWSGKTTSRGEGRYETLCEKSRRAESHSRTQMDAPWNSGKRTTLGGSGRSYFRFNGRSPMLRCGQ